MTAELVFLAFTTQQWLHDRTLVHHHYHHFKPNCVHCRTRASPIFFQITLSYVYCSHIVPANFLISSAHLTFCRPQLGSPSLGDEKRWHVSVGLHEVTTKIHQITNWRYGSVKPSQTTCERWRCIQCVFKGGRNSGLHWRVLWKLISAAITPACDIQCSNPQT